MLRVTAAALEASQMDSRPDPPRQPSMPVMIVWVLLCFWMWGWAIIGTMYIVIGTLYFTVAPIGDYISIEGATTQEKLRNMAIAGLLGAVGITFVCLHRLGYLRFGDRKP
jgi:hypothetical protein